MTSTSTSTSTELPLKSLPDHYYFSDQDDPLDYYDNVDEISIPSSITKPFNNIKNHSSIKSSSSSLSQATAQVRHNEPLAQQNRLQYKLPDYESRYDQSTLKSFFMFSTPSTEGISFADLRAVTTTEKPVSTSSPMPARDFEVQRQKILSYIISENQPSSFKAPPSSTSQKPLVLATNQDINANYNKNPFKAYVNTQEALESTTISHPNTTSTNSPNIIQSPTKTTLLLSRDQLAQNKPIRLTLTASLDSGRPTQLTRNQYTQGAVEEIPLVKSRQPEIKNQELRTQEVKKLEFEVRKPEIEVRKPEFEVRKPEFEVRKPEFEVQKPKYEIRKPEFEVRKPEFEVQKAKYEIRKPEFEIRKPEFEVQKPKYEVQKPEFEVQKPKYEIRKPELNVRKPEIQTLELSKSEIRQFETEYNEHKDRKQDIRQPYVREFEVRRPEIRPQVQTFGIQRPEIRQSQVKLPEISEYKVPETRQSLYLKPIEPTTYSPPKPFRTSTEAAKTTQSSTTSTTTTTTTTELPIPIILEEIDMPEPFSTHSRRRPYVNDFLANSNNIPTRFPPRVSTEALIETTSQAPTSTTTFRSVIQSFTSRGLVFKENLNRTFAFEPQNFKAIVSPYTSLETQRLTNAIRTTTPTQRPIEYSTTTSSPPSTYRSYFLITAPIKNKTIPSTFLFPETSTIQSSSMLTEVPTTVATTQLPQTAKPSPFSLPTESNLFLSTENSRGRYRPYVSSPSQNTIEEEATTYSPRLRYNTRTQTMVDSVSSSSPPTEQTAVRRKIVRLKSGLNKPENIFAESTTTSTSLRPVSEKFVASPSRDTSQFKPIVLSKSNEFAGKLSYSSDSPSVVSRNSFNQLPKDEQLPNVASTEKPFYYIRFKNASASFEPFETSTKKFRATVEMPEMNVPTEKELNAFVDEEVYDEEENDHQNPLENDNRDVHEVDYAYVDSTTTSTTTTTVAPSTKAKPHFNTTYSSTVYATSTYPTTTSTLTSTTTESTQTSTANPKSLIPPRASRVNSAIKTSINVAGLPRRSNSASIKCNDISANAKCNEIPSRYYTKQLFQNPKKNKKKIFSIR